MSTEVTTVEAPTPIIAPEAPAIVVPTKTLKQLRKEYKEIRKRIAKEKKQTTLKGAELSAFLETKKTEKKEAQQVVFGRVREILKAHAKKESTKRNIVKKATHLESRDARKAKKRSLF
jgi:hypothetical protein